MDKTRYVLAKHPFLNAQFMGLFKALTELRALEPGTRDFAEHLTCMAGLLRFQFGFEEDLLWDMAPDRCEQHLAQHERLRGMLAGLLMIPEGDIQQHVEDHRRFLHLLAEHCKGEDNELLSLLSAQKKDTTVRMRIRSRIIQPPDVG